jgi:signal transduction histidine kinase
MKSFVNMLKLQLKRPKGFRSLTVTLAFAFLTLSFFVLFVYSSLSIYFSFRNQREVIDIQQQLIAQKAADSVKAFIDDKFTALDSAINVTNLYRASRKDQKLVLEKLLGMEPSFRHLILFDTQEQELLYVSRLSHMVSGQLAERIRQELFSQARWSEPYISSITIDETTSEPMVLMAIPVTDVFGDFQGVLAAEVNLKFMWDLMEQIKIGGNGYAYVVDMNGYLIAFRDISRVLKRENLGYLEEVREFAEGHECVHVSEAEISKGILGSPVLTTHVHLGTPDWAVVVELPILEAYETVIRTCVFSILIMIFSFILAIISGIFLSHKMTRPIIKLRDATRRIGKGNLDTRIEIESKDEIGELASSFNQMIEDLKKVTVSRDALVKEVQQRKRAEKQLKRYAAELERSNEEVKNFAYIVSHDLRVPLVNLKGYTSELRSALEAIESPLETTLSQLNEEERSAVATALHEDVPEALEFITTSVSRMDSFINSVLHLSRLGRRELKPEPVDMKALVQATVETLAHQIHERGIEVTVGSLPDVVADRISMEQIMGNILGNAVKYLDHERPGQIEVTAKNNHSETIFHIRDNGRGIAEDDMGKVFAPFRRAGKQDTPGEGMGLAYVQTLVRRHGGRIWCESKPGKGTTFTFTIAQYLDRREDRVSDR